MHPTTNEPTIGGATFLSPHPSQRRQESRRSDWMLLAWLAVLWLGTAGAGFGAVAYSVVDLGYLGVDFARARAINGQGQVVGEALVPAPGTVEHAFFWQSGAMVDLGTLGGQRSRAYDINNAGIISGWAQNASGNLLPALWTGGVATALPTLGGTIGSAWGLNDAGTAVGLSYLNPSTYHAALWNEGGVRDLGTLGGSYSVAYDINNPGTAVGTAYDSAGRERACLWGPAGPVDMGGLSGGQWTAARAINDSGQVILWGTPSGSPRNHAGFWNGDSLSPVIDLGTFGGAESWAYGLNNRGSVVGWAELPGGTYHAFVWDGTERIDLGTLGGSFSSAYGINDQGTIVGFATDAEVRTHAVAWMPVPEPAAVLLGLLAGGAFVLWARFGPHPHSSPERGTPDRSASKAPTRFGARRRCGPECRAPLWLRFRRAAFFSAILLPDLGRRVALSMNLPLNLTRTLILNLPSDRRSGLRVGLRVRARAGVPGWFNPKEAVEPKETKEDEKQEGLAQ